MEITVINGITTLRQLGLLGTANFNAAEVPNRLGVTSAIKSDSQRLSRVLLLSGIERKQSKLPFESPTMVRFQEENGCNNSKFGL